MTFSVIDSRWTLTYLFFNQGSQGKVIKEIGKVFPNIHVSVFHQAFVVEAVDLCDLPRFVIATKNGDAMSKPYFERHEKRDRLDRVVSSVDVVSHEEIICIWRVSSDAEQLHQVMKLTVNITTDGDRTFDRLYIGFFL